MQTDSKKHDTPTDANKMNILEIALKTFNEEIPLHKDNPYVWHFWKRAFDSAFRELTKEGYWLPLDIQPPEKELLVIDEFGNTGVAKPTYYPFEVIKKEGDEKKPVGFRGTPVFYEDGKDRWDGGWMVKCEGLGSKIKGRIVGWRVAQHSI